MADHTQEMAMPVRRLEGFPRPILMLSAALFVLGAVTFAFALATDATRAWQAYLYNWIYWTTIAAGGVMLSVAVNIARGIWARPIRRIALSMVAFLPIALLLLVPLFFAGRHIFTWFGQDLHGKEAYLNIPFFVVRNAVLMLALVVLAIVYAYWALRPDAGLLKSEVPSHLRGLYARLTGGWRGQETEEVIATKKLAIYGPILAIVWSLALSVVSWDFVMSNEAHWYSTMIGPYVFMAGFLGGIAVTAILALIYRSKLNLAGTINAPQFHDLGKLTFAFCVVWAYLFWSQYLVIWYGMLPWEQTYVVHRLSAPYTPMAYVIFFSIFVVPFFGLLGMSPKRSPAVLALFASIALFGLWLERYILIYPSFYPGAAVLPFGWQEIGVTLAFAGLFIASIAWFASRFPVLQVWEPLVDLSLEGDERGAALNQG